MNTIANKMAVKIKQLNPQQTHSVELMQYALTILLNTLFVIICSLLIGAILHTFLQTFLVLATLMITRFFSGGQHFKSAWACNIFSIFLCVAIPLIPQLSDKVLLVSSIISFIIMLFLAPKPDKNSNLPKRLHPFFKMVSIAIALLPFFADSQILGLAIFTQSISLISLRKGG
jgi:accessory gene regulator B